MTQMSKYNLNEAKFGTHSLIAEEIANEKLVLDVGCGKGYLKKLAPGNNFYGIDNNRDDLEQANCLGYQNVYCLDLNDYVKFTCNLKFDIIIFADILEHLFDPEKVLRRLSVNYLKEGGKVIVSLPNVANIFIRFHLLFGNFNYTESGILDKTHLHLYTEKTAEIMIENSNLKIKKVKFSSNKFGRLLRFFPILGSLLGYNLIFVCEKK